jgi:regulator of sirC expression with transglutaminase-like and TPR domain
MRSHQTRLRSGKQNHVQLARALGGDAVFRNQAAEHIARRLLKQTIAQNVDFLLQLELHWAEADYCLARAMDLQSVEKRTVKKRGMTRTALAALRRAVERAWEERERAEECQVTQTKL